MARDARRAIFGAVSGSRNIVASGDGTTPFGPAGGLSGSRDTGAAMGSAAADEHARASRSDALLRALDRVAAFPPGRAHELAIDPSELARRADAEASGGLVALGPRGLSPGERLAILQPARHLISEWRAARAAFDVAIEPFMADLAAAAALERETAELERRSQSELAAITRRADDDHGWRETRDRMLDARHRFEESRLAHANRDANMRSYHPLYWVGLVLIGAAEWLINYDTLVMFFGIPAMAIGATAILAFAMAFASHAHGIVWKQWSQRFGRHRSGTQRASSVRLLGLGSLALGAVLLFAGFSRFAVVMHQAGAQPAQNILGAQAAVAFDPGRDVLISLLANLLAWLVGTFLSFFCHDEDPDHMEATAQYTRWHKRFLRADRPYRADREVAEARIERELGERRRAAEARRARVRPQAEMLAQVEAHELAVMRATHAAIQRNLGFYRAALADAAIRHGAVITAEPPASDALLFDHAGIAPEAPTLDAASLRNRPHTVDLDTVRALA